MSGLNGSGKWKPNLPSATQPKKYSTLSPGTSPTPNLRASFNNRPNDNSPKESPKRDETKERSLSGGSANPPADESVDSEDKSGYFSRKFSLTRIRQIRSDSGIGRSSDPNASTDSFESLDESSFSPTSSFMEEGVMSDSEMKADSDEVDPRTRSQSHIAKVLSSRNEVDRSDWALKLKRNNPEISELKDRLTPVDRAVAFGEVYIPKRDELQATLSKQTVTQLILQHLQYEGLKKSRIQLERAMNQKLNANQIDMQESRLVNILRIAVNEVDRIWDLTMPDKYAEDEELEEHLYEFGLLEEDLESSEDMNIWEEPEEDNIIMYTPPNSTKQAIKGATLNKLVVQLTSDKDHDMEFQQIFLMTYQSFTTPEKLLQKLMQRYQPPESAQKRFSDQEIKLMQTTIQPRIVNVLKKWLGNHWSDLNEQHIETFKSFMEKNIKATSDKLYTLLQRKIKSTQDEKKQLVFKDPPPEPKIDLKTIFSPTLSLFDIDDIEIARQFTIMEYDLFTKIKPYELLNQSWTKPKLKHRAVNVLNLINRSTEISSWVSSVIVREPKLRNRIKIYTRFIKIAEQLRKLNNFSTLMAIMAGLSNAAVFRLRFTREEVPRQYQQVYETLVQHTTATNGYRVYRELIANVQLPCIPFIGVYLTDLVFMDDGNPNYLPSPKEGKDLINFAKRRIMYGIIGQIQQQQQASYNLQPVHQVLALLKTDRLKQQKLEEKELWKLSLIHEPKDADKTTLE